jgi:choline dehydrogenase-like flavoprotein
VKRSVDLVVIGSGCGGATLAAAQAARGRSVLILEQGSRWQAKDFTQREIDMFEKLYAEGGATGPKDLSSTILYGRAVGGSSLHYMANSFRMPAQRLEEWTRDHGLVGFTPDALAPYYAQVERDHHVHPATESETNANNRIFRRGVQALGWKGEQAPNARKECANAGFCLLGCPHDRKQSQILTNIPKALAHGAELVANARVTRIVVEGGRARGVEVVVTHPVSGETIERATVTAKVVVLAAGGVGSPALLLANGLANGSGQVGRNFVVTPHFFTMGLMRERVEGWTGLPCSYVCREWEPVRGNEGGFMIQGIFAQPGMIATVTPGFGREHRAMMEKLPHFAAVLSLIDDEEPGRVTVSPTGRAEIDYHLRGRDIPKARDFFRKSARILLAGGAEEVMIPSARALRIRNEGDLGKIDALTFAPHEVPFFGTTNTGACRMGADPKRSVVDPYGRAHDVANLYLSDGSILPGSPGVDPSLTIMANALRIADHLESIWTKL